MSRLFPPEFYDSDKQFQEIQNNSKNYNSQESSQNNSQSPNYQQVSLSKRANSYFSKNPDKSTSNNSTNLVYSSPKSVSFEPNFVTQNNFGSPKQNPNNSENPQIQNLNQNQTFWNHRTIFLFSTVFLLLISVISFGVFSFNSQNIDSSKSSKSEENKASNMNKNLDFSNFQSLKEKIKPKNLTLRMLFLGNTFWGRYIDDWSKASPLKEKYPFSGLETLEKDKYDAWISGLECPITSTYRSSELQDSDLKFSCPSEYTKEAAKWFEAFTLANNHTDNMEKVGGFLQTKKNLAENGIQSFGHFNSDVSDELCKVISLPVRSNLEIEKNKSNSQNFQGGSDNSKVNSSQNSSQNSTNYNSEKNLVISSQNFQEKYEKYSVPIALCGYHNVFKLPTADQLAKITEYSKYLPTIVMPHGGAEYTTKADGIKTSLYRQMIELGADAVIGDHPHSVQNTEVWRDRLIVYSLGNFLFDQQGSQALRQSLVIDGEINLEFDQNLEKWTELAKICKTQNLQTENLNNFENNSENLIEKKLQNPNSQKSEIVSQNSKNLVSQDQNCLEIAKTQNLQKPKFLFSWEALATDSTGKLTKKANPQITQNVLQIANWTQTKKELENLKMKKLENK